VEFTQHEGYRIACVPASTERECGSYSTLRVRRTISRCLTQITRCQRISICRSSGRRDRFRQLTSVCHRTFDAHHESTQVV
jgi:hypothetical protein